MFNNFSIIFLSILFEALPFVLLGSLISSLIEVFVTPSFIAEHIPKNKFLGYLAAGLMGIIFPVCECAIVPIMRRLVKKGAPVGLSLTFMLAVPIVNPIVLLSTYYAFGTFTAPLLRGVLGLSAALIIGYAFDRVSSDDFLKEKKRKMPSLQANLSRAPKLNASSTKISIPKKSKISTLQHVISHTNSELFDVGKLLIIGAFLSASMQIFIPRELLLQFGNHPVLSVSFMMLFAFVLSICSEADAFIASSFKYSFTSGSLIAFLIFGPMIDIKNTLMLAGVIKRKFVIRLIATISVVCFIISLILTLFNGGIWL